VDVFTVGHSSHSVAAFAGLLRGAGVVGVVDVRRWPRSRRHPHFDDDALAVELAASGIAYAHVVELGGHREPVAGSPSDGWELPAFNGYADHLGSAEFARGLEKLMALAGARPTAVMCAEGDWHRCHRQLIADVVELRGLAHVLHVGVDGAMEPHAITPFAVFEGDSGLPRYPAQQLGLGF
jgi:uncharacterized protein (DUF488 family)